MNRKPKISLAASVAIILIGLGSFYGWRVRQQRSAGDILLKVAEVYANCSSYQDSGTASARNGSFKMSLKFTTSFVRPDRFRHESLHDDRMLDGSLTRCVVWRNGAQVSYWTTLHSSMKPPETFRAAIVAATGVSITTAHTIPALIFSKDEIPGQRITNMKNATPLGDATLGGVPCYRIQGKSSVFDTIVWIGREDLLIRRIERATERGGTTVVDYQPSINVEIPAAALEFQASQ